MVMHPTGDWHRVLQQSRPYCRIQVLPDNVEGVLINMLLAQGLERLDDQSAFRVLETYIL